MATPTSYIRASFRGVPFYLKRTDLELGRRTVLHKYPQRDKPFAEDLGRLELGFTLSAYLSGADLTGQRKRMEAALQAPGPGTLVLPERGEMRVSVMPSSISDSPDERGRLTMSLHFVESGEEVMPDAVTDTQSVVADAVASAHDALKLDFLARFSIDGLADYALQDVIRQVDYVLTTVETLQRSLLSDYNSYSDLMSDALIFRARIANVMRMPGDLVDQVTGFVQSIQTQIFPSIAAKPVPQFGGQPATVPASAPDAAPAWANVGSPGQQAFDVMQSLWTYEGAPATQPWPETLPLTPMRRQQQAVEQVVIEHVRGTALLESAAAVAAIPFESFDQSQQVQLAFFDGISEYMTQVRDDDLYFALKAVRSAVSADITARGATLARVRTTTLAQTTPALVLSYRLYGTPDHADDLVTRNVIEHPLQLPGGRSLEVLTDG
ncbi:DNA circularization protein [Burkholderia cenocepacia]|uniref:DNA circularization protein n=1 Tax=Burkholderia cenocepacia TaxID=95486 RepID=UPI001B9074A3|nr:DNA circularization N-terminal domain-containing protein [Burkholderia cenocepacia]MBR8137183.1 DNA circularization N-terminal domain-containing protein [Burkholderia cenocepacia]